MVVTTFPFCYTTFSLLIIFYPPFPETAHLQWAVDFLLLELRCLFCLFIHSFFFFFAVTTNILYVLKWPAIPFSSFSVTLLLGLLDYFVCYICLMYALLEGLGSATSISELN